MLTIYGNDHSSCVQKVIWCAEELRLPYTRIDKGGSFGGLDDPEYIKLNPNRLIPTINDDGFVLWDSCAILCYLSSKYGKGTLYPIDDRARGEAYRWVFWQNGTVRGAIMPLYMQWRVWKPAYRHLEELERFRRGMQPIWRIVEDQLASQQWLAGETFSMADIPMGIMRANFPARVWGRAPHLFDTQRLDTTSLYSTLEQDLGIVLWKAKETVEAALAGADADLLDLTPEDLLLVVHRRTVDDSGRPVEYTQLRYRADLYRYNVELFRHTSSQANQR